MTAAIQPALDGTLPPPPRERRDDYDEWLEEIRPTFAKVAATRRRFVSWQIKVEYRLPDPPDPNHQWGRAMAQFHADGLLKRAGWGEAVDQSGVRRWEGTRAARRRAA